jgi:hypothetical protein
MVHDNVAALTVSDFVSAQRINDRERHIRPERVEYAGIVISEAGPLHGTAKHHGAAVAPLERNARKYFRPVEVPGVGIHVRAAPDYDRYLLPDKLEQFGLSQSFSSSGGVIVRTLTSCVRSISAIWAMM